MNLKKLLPIFGIIILLFIIASLDLKQIYNAFSNISPLYLFIAFFAIIPVVILSNIQWQILLKKQKIKVSFLYSLKNIFIGYFYGFISPGGLGAYTRVLYLQQKSKAPLAKCASNIIIFNTIDFLSLLLIGAIGAILFSSIYPNLLLTITITIIIIIFLLILLFLKKEKSKIILQKLIQTRIFTPFKEKLTKSLDSFYEDIPRIKDVLLPFFISLFGWIIKFAEFYLISRLFSINVPFVYFILMIAIANIIASIPISIYGLGTRDAALITMFSIFNVLPEKVISLTLLWFVIIWLTPSVIGAFVTFFETKNHQKFLINEKTVESFSKYMKKHPELYKHLANIVKSNINKETDKPVIVDLGIGPGWLSLETSKLITNAKIIGIDPSELMLKKTKINVKKDTLEIIKATSENIPLKNNSVDIIVSRFSLTYWKKPIESFSEIQRVLKPNGKIVLEALNLDFPKTKLFLIKINMFFKSAGIDVIRYHSEAYKTAYKIQHIEQLLKQKDFKITYKDTKEKAWKYIIVAEKQSKKSLKSLNQKQLKN
jgi:uncharacterized protein (TIRG00374 family)